MTSLLQVQDRLPQLAPYHSRKRPDRVTGCFVEDRRLHRRSVSDVGHPVKPGPIVVSAPFTTPFKAWIACATAAAHFDGHALGLNNISSNDIGTVPLGRVPGRGVRGM